MRIKINDKIYRLEEIESGVDSLMELVEEQKYKDGDFVYEDGRIPKRKFKIGDKVRIKEGISSKTHRGEHPYFMGGMDELIEKELTVGVCANGIVCIEESGYNLHEDWLEPYAEELKNGDLAIFWQFDKTQAVVRLFDNEQGGLFQIPTYVDNTGHWWANSIKFEGKGQFKRLINGEI